MMMGEVHRFLPEHVINLGLDSYDSTLMTDLVERAIDVPLDVMAPFQYLLKKIRFPCA